MRIGSLVKLKESQRLRYSRMMQIYDPPFWLFFLDFIPVDRAEISHLKRIRIRLSDPRSLGLWCLKGTDESTLIADSSVPLMHHDPSDIGSLIRIRITTKERTLIVLV